MSRLGSIAAAAPAETASMPRFGMENPIRPVRCNFMQRSSNARVWTMDRYICSNTSRLRRGALPTLVPVSSMIWKSSDMHCFAAQHEMLGRLVRGTHQRA